MKKRLIIESLLIEAEEEVPTKLPKKTPVILGPDDELPDENNVNTANNPNVDQQINQNNTMGAIDQNQIAPNQQNIQQDPNMQGGVPGGDQQYFDQNTEQQIAQGGGQMGGMVDPNAMAAGGAMDPSMIGSDQPLDPNTIGKIYILKKIYSKLISLDNSLESFTHPKYDELRSSLSECLLLFRSVVVNFAQFKDSLDEIIKGFQKFLVVTVQKLEKLSTADSKEE